MKRFETDADLVPDAVAQLVLSDHMPPAKAWRTYLKLTQAEVAKRMGITQSAYAQLEYSENLQKNLRAKIAAALSITAAQLDF